MVGLRDLGARVHLFSQDGDDLGFCHLSWPVSVGDLATVEGATYRIVDFVDLPAGTVDTLAVVEPTPG
jgi:hypothetical protein